MLRDVLWGDEVWGEGVWEGGGSETCLKATFM